FLRWPLILARLAFAENRKICAVTGGHGFDSTEKQPGELDSVLGPRTAGYELQVEVALLRLEVLVHQEALCEFVHHPGVDGAVIVIQRNVGGREPPLPVGIATRWEPKPLAEGQGFDPGRPQVRLPELGRADQAVSLDPKCRLGARARLTGWEDIVPNIVAGIEPEQNQV